VILFLGLKTDILANIERGIAGKIHLDNNQIIRIKNKYPNVI
jgi:hypothetical protein